MTQNLLVVDVHDLFPFISLLENCLRPSLHFLHQLHILITLQHDFWYMLSFGILLTLLEFLALLNLQWYCTIHSNVLWLREEPSVKWICSFALLNRQRKVM